MKKIFALIVLSFLSGCVSIEKVAIRATPVNGKLEFSVEVFPKDVDISKPRPKMKG